MEQDITKKLTKVTITTNTFTPEGGLPTQYKRLVLHFVHAGNVKQMQIKISPDQLLVLETLPESEDADFLKQNPTTDPNQTQIVG